MHPPDEQFRRPNESPSPEAAGERSATILLAYDGSREARDAARSAVALLRGRVIVLYVWSPAAAVAAPAATPATMQPVMPVPPLEDAITAERYAQEVLVEGIELCRAGGLTGEGVLVPGVGVGDVAQVIVAAGDEYDADVIVVGRRDRSAFAGTLLGSVSKSVVAATDRPVLVVSAG